MEKYRDMVSFSVETAVYPLEAVYAAANVFSGKAFVRIGAGKKGRVSVELRGKPGEDVRARVLEGEFYNELLHHALRLKVAVRHQGLREKIVAQALVSAQAPGAANAAAVPAADKAVDAELEREIEKLLKEAETGGYRSDPLAIAVPWEKKQRRKPGK